jgi:pimeloyl-ACP methyl ester carboxylesterase
MPSLSGIEEWWSNGERLTLSVNGSERAVFVRRMGAGPAMTLLHGFPSSSHDWAKVAPTLAARRELLMVDFLGFGASEKPTDHDYSLREQTDLVEALWRRDGVTSTVVVAHDYAVSVAQELLARRAEGTLGTALDAIHLLNGGLYPDIHRPLPTQIALLDPDRGAQLSAMINEELFVGGLKPTFAESFDAAADSADMWRAMSRDDGQQNMHLLTRYIRDRAIHRERWVTALQDTDVPVAFIWGMLDPVSGAHMAERIRERMPQAPFQALDDVGHWPQLEVPQRVAAAVLGASPG